MNVYKKSMNYVAPLNYIITFVSKHFGRIFVNTKTQVSDYVASHSETPDNQKPSEFSLKASFFAIVNKVGEQACPLPLKNLLKNYISHCPKPFFTGKKNPAYKAGFSAYLLVRASFNAIHRIKQRNSNTITVPSNTSLDTVSDSDAIRSETGLTVCICTVNIRFSGSYYILNFFSAPILFGSVQSCRFRPCTLVHGLFYSLKPLL